jgi:hypothetical protein
MSEPKASIALPPCEEVQSQISRLNVKPGAPEVHGSMCGFLCVGSSDKAQQYIQSLLEESDVNKFETDVRALASLLQISYKQMSTMSFDFHLLMPDDDAPLEERAKALGLWCQGFSDGVLNAGIDISKISQEETRDALFHITEIANIDYTYTTVTEKDEKAFMEVYEYVRMAVLMIHTELTQPHEGESGDGNEPTLH